MISLDEMKYTLNRLEIIKNNVDDAEEKYTCDILSQNIAGMIKQIEQFKQSPEFKKAAAEMYKKEEE